VAFLLLRKFPSALGVVGWEGVEPLFEEYIKFQKTELSMDVIGNFNILTKQMWQMEMVQRKLD
jgi:hypothetical protein